MFLIQLLLPVNTTIDAVAELNLTQDELRSRFGGITAYLQTPAKGQWTAPSGSSATDWMILMEIVAKDFDRTWWRGYAAALKERFRQDVVHIRALQVEVLDPASV